MGWWEITNDKSGQINWEIKRESSLINAIPGQHDPNKMYNGDEPADAMDFALDKIEEIFLKAWGRKPSYDELLSCFNFCSKSRYDEET